MLEEYGKVLRPRLGRSFKRLRFEMYRWKRARRRARTEPRKRLLA
ncbi:MAG: hypothetical protein IPP09_05800 [Elusimicrobia bacterium]|nr:hypothetical protein [Elusimicrobiota bacterium]